jgi:hypothetical protein
VKLTQLALIATAVCGLGVLSPVAEAAAKKGSLLVRIDDSESLTRPQKMVGASSYVPTSSKTLATSTKADSSSDKISVSQRHIRALDLAMKGDTTTSLDILKGLQSAKMSDDEHDRVWLTTGRVKYQAGDYSGAIEAYQAVRKGSPTWLEALEERASAQMRLGQTEQALGTLKTVLTPLFKDRILSEPYFLTSLAQLRVCDYKSVFKTIDLFKVRFRDRVKEWDAAKNDAGAQALLRETRETIQKLNLVEAEAIQHLYIDENGKRQAGTPPKIGRERDQLTFPMDSEMDSKEVWLDEVDDYRVTVKGCPVEPPAQSPGQSSGHSASQPTAESAKKARTL